MVVLHKDCVLTVIYCVCVPCIQPSFIYWQRVIQEISFRLSGHHDKIKEYI